MDDHHDDTYSNQTVHGRHTRKTVVATNEDENNYLYRGTMIGGRRRAGVCRVNQKGGYHDSNRTQQSATEVMAMKEGYAMVRGGMRRRFVFIFTKK
jgi:hypothetical protein